MSVHDRLAAREARPALMRLDRALSRLGSVLTVMNTGAHPDDEHSGLLAWFRYGLGMRVVIACSTRGEGGQNAHLFSPFQHCFGNLFEVVGGEGLLALPDLHQGSGTATPLVVAHRGPTDTAAANAHFLGFKVVGCTGGH